MERGQYGRRPSPVYQHYPSHQRNIHGSHLDRRPESAGGGKVAETYKVRSVKVSQVFLGHRERSGADAGGWSFQVALITSVQHLAMTWCCSVWVSGLELNSFLSILSPYKKGKPCFPIIKMFLGKQCFRIKNKRLYHMVIRLLSMLLAKLQSSI